MCKSIFALAALFAVGGVGAAELGALTVYSATGEPFDAKLTLRDVDAGAQIRVRQASASTYVRVGRKAETALQSLTVTRESGSPYALRLQSKTAVNNAVFPLILELSEAGKLSAKLYEIKLRETEGPSASTSPRQETAPGQSAAPSAPVVAPTKADSTVPSASVVPSASAVFSAASSQTTAPAVPGAMGTVSAAELAAGVPAVENKPVKAHRSVPLTPTKVESKTEPVRVESTKSAAAAPVRSAEASAKADPVKLPLNPVDYDLDKPFVVREGMTMWSIAMLYRPRYPQATMDQILVAFVRANPHAYEAGRVNGVIPGSTLTAPLVGDVDAVGLDEAWALVRVNVRADAGKAPSKKDLQTARIRMKKEAPSLYRKVQADIAREQAQEKEAVAQRIKASRQDVKPKTSKVDPLAETIAASELPAQPQAPVAESVPEPQSAPEPVKAEKPAVTAPEAKTEPAAVPVKAEEKSGMTGWLVAFILAALAVLAGVVCFFKRRNEAKRRKELEKVRLSKVVLMKSEPASDEQLKGIEEMSKRRFESDQAARRGFTPKADRVPPEIKTMMPAEKNVQGEATALSVPQAEVHETQTAAPIGVQTAAPAESETPASESVQTVVAQPESHVQLFVQPPMQASVQTDPWRDSAPAEPVQPAAPAIQPVAPTAEPYAQGFIAPSECERKLSAARTYINVGGYMQAMRLLREVESAGRDDQCERARAMIAEIECSRG